MITVVFQDGSKREYQSLKKALERTMGNHSATYMYIPVGDEKIVLCHSQNCWIIMGVQSED